MILLIDVGNYRIKWARWIAGEPLCLNAAVWRQRDLIRLFSELWMELSPQRVVACNVAGDRLAQALEQWCHAQWQRKVEFVRAAAQCAGVVSAYPRPHDLGDDRWAAMIGARRLINGPICVIDCGTAVTVDLLASDGRHLGGAILPGLTTMRRSLRKETHDLTVEPLDSGPLANNTAGGIAAGTLYGLVGAVERLVDEARKHIGEPLRCVLTGGDAARLEPLFRFDSTLAPDLVLQGLAVGTGIAK